ncbi:NAD(P)H-dependent oxidoreductase [Halobacteriovorax sp. GB3]|nr:NAD(P)H-dependent oxidoreductase [Halobacteriovorax sp. GB3]MDD0852481.1 NAD(P)H-dependent oxidoreductase [Halobacteriovorax sp. GB3]
MNEQILEALDWRYATKIFDADKKINEKDWNTLVESVRLAPSSYGLQPWKFIVVENKELRAKLREVSWNQSQVTDASHYLVFTTLEKLDAQYVDKFVADIAKTRGLQVEDLAGYRDMMVGNLVEGPRSQTIDAWAQRQSYIAMGQLTLAAGLLKIDTCALEGLDPAAYDKLLGLEDGPYKTIAAVALGYRKDDDKYKDLKKVRFDQEEVFEYKK